MASQTLQHPHGPFRLVVELAEPQLRLSLHGELDFSCTDLIEGIDLRDRHAVTSVEVNLRELSFVDSVGARALLDLEEAQTAQGRQVRMLNAGPLVLRLFTLVRQHRLQTAS